MQSSQLNERETVIESQMSSCACCNEALDEYRGVPTTGLTLTVVGLQRSLGFL